VGWGELEKERSSTKHGNRIDLQQCRNGEKEGEGSKKNRGRKKDKKRKKENAAHRSQGCAEYYLLGGTLFCPGGMGGRGKTPGGEKKGAEKVTTTDRMPGTLGSKRLGLTESVGGMHWVREGEAGKRRKEVEGDGEVVRGCWQANQTVLLLRAEHDAGE